MFDSQATTLRTLNNIKKSLKENLKNKYNIDNEETANKFLKIHGLGKQNFDFISSIESVINENLNDVSIDSNSNKNEKTIEAINQECVSPIKKAVGYDYLYRQLKDLYGPTEASFLVGEMMDLSLGLSDSTNILKPYCWAVDASKIITFGRDFGQLHSKPAKRVSSYISALCETVHQLSSHLAGAIAIGSFFLDIAHLSLYKEKFDLREIKTNKKYRKVLENEMQQFVHSVNHLSRSGAESPFTNLSIFDRLKLRTLIQDMNWYFPFDKLSINHPKKLEGNEEEIKNFYLDYIVDFIIEIQDVFLDFFDKGDPLKGGAPYRFPVVTLNFSKKWWGDRQLIQDEEFLKNVCKRDIYRYNIFVSEGTKVASCCLTSTTKVLARVDGVVKYITVKQLFDIWNISNQNKNIEIMGKKGFVKIIKGYQIPSDGTIQKKKKKNGLVISTTLDHPSVKIGDGKLVKVRADELKLNDQIPVSKNLSYKSDGGSRELGKFVGLFGAEGLFDKRRSSNINFCFNTNEKELQNFVKEFSLKYFGSNSRVDISKIWPSSSKVEIQGYTAHGLMKDFFFCILATDKRLKSKIFQMSEEFRIGFLEGFIYGDGYTKNNERSDYGSIHIANKNLALDLTCLANSVNIKSSWRKTNTGWTVNFLHNNKLKLEPLKNWHGGSGAKQKSTILNNYNDFYGIEIENIEIIKTKKENVYDFTVETDEHIFQIANGIITHNCRLVSNTEMLEYASQSNSFGGSGISLGSHRVCTINFMRIAMEAKSKEEFYSILDARIESAAKILKAHKELIKSLEKKGLQPFISNGWIVLNRLFSTFGILGIYEAAKVCKQKFGNGKDVEGDMLVHFNQKVADMSEKYGIIGNIEQIPGESFAIRLSKSDKLIYGEENIPYELYSNQWIPLWSNATIWEKMDADGKYNSLITGGCLVHIQIGEKVTAKQAEKIIKYSINSGAEHFALNSVYSECVNGHCMFGKHTKCPECGADIKEYYSRVVGFFTPVSSWQDTRREWEFPKRTFVDLSIVDESENN